MSRIKYWLSELGIWLWSRFRDKQTFIAFRHTCGSEAVQLAAFRGSEAEFKCFKCNTFVPSKDISFRILPAKEIEEIKVKARQNTDCSMTVLYKYFKSGVSTLPHLVA